MATPTEDFLADPEGFMMSHIVICQFFKAGLAPNGVERMTIVEQDLDDYYGSTDDQPDAQFPIYTVIDGSNRPPTDRFDAFFCPYANDTTNFTTLTATARYMFTPTMDGCSFGIGSPSGNGTVIVGHSNAQRNQTATSTRPMEITQKAELKATLLPQYKAKRSPFKKKYKIFEPRKYRIDSVTQQRISATLYGIRNGNKWKFHVIKFIPNPGTLPIHIEYKDHAKV